MISRRNFALQTLAGMIAAPLAVNAQTKRTASAGGALSEEFQAKLPQLMDWANVPGVAVAVLKDGKPAWSRGFGVKKAGEPGAVAADTLFGAASLSKVLVSYALLKMRDEKLIDLDRPLWNYLPYEDLPAGDQARAITARHALSHSTGLQNWRFGRDDKLAFAFKPGEAFQYSGEGFYYLSRVIETISGRGFEEYMQEHVLKPLGMANSTYSWTAATEAKLAWGHNGRLRPSEIFNASRGRQMLAAAEQSKKPLASWRHEDVLRLYTEMVKDGPPPFPNFLLPNAAGSLISSVDEYAMFMGRLLRPKGDGLDLSDASRREMLSPQNKVNSALSWGLGVGLESYNGRQMFWHWGDNGVFKAFMMGDPANGSGVVVFTNAQNGHKIWQRIVAEALGPDHPSFYFFMT